MVRWSALSSRSLEGLPLAWGAKVHAGPGHWDPFFLQAAEGQGALACSDCSSGFLFSWEVMKTLIVGQRGCSIASRPLN
jgi:hypothetical protein